MRWAMVSAAQAWIFVFSGLAAFLLRFDFNIPAVYLHRMIYALPIWIVVKSIVFHIAKSDRRGLRYVSVSDAYRLLIANFAGSALSYALICLAVPEG